MLCTHSVNYGFGERDWSIFGFGYMFGRLKEVGTDIGIVEVLMSWSSHDEKHKMRRWKPKRETDNGNTTRNEKEQNRLVRPMIIACAIREWHWKIWFIRNHEKCTIICMPCGPARVWSIDGNKSGHASDCDCECERELAQHIMTQSEKRLDFVAIAHTA